MGSGCSAEAESREVAFDYYVFSLDHIEIKEIPPSSRGTISGMAISNKADIKISNSLLRDTAPVDTL